MSPIYLTKSIGFFPEHHTLKDIILLLLYSTSNNSRAKNTATQVAMLEAANYYYNSHHPIKTLLSHDAVIINQLNPVLSIYGTTSDA